MGQPESPQDPTRSDQPTITGWVGRGVAAAVRSSLQLTAGSVRAAGNGAALVIPIITAPVEATFNALYQGTVAVESVAAATADTALRLTIRVIVDAALRELDLDQIVREHLDIDSLAAGLDLDAIIDRLDINAIAAGIDLDAIVDRLNIGRVLDRVDIDEVAGRIDIDAITARIDLNEIATRIDVDPLIQRADIDAVIARVDLLSIAAEVIDGIDLPSIIRQSTGALSSDAVKGIRSQSRTADDALAAFVGRLFGKSDSDTVVSS